MELEKNGDKEVERQLRSVSIAGFYGVNNIGDEAILTAMIDQFSSMREIQLHVLALEPKSVRKTYQISSSNCMFHKDPLSFIRATSTCDLFILGGGELIHDYSIWRHPVLGVFFSKVFGKKTMTYAVSVRPFKNSIGVAVFRNALEAFDIITVRDYFSKDYISSLGITKKIYVTGDPTLLLKPKFIRDEDLPKYGVPITDEAKVGVNIRRLGDFLDGTVEKQVARICDSLISKINARIIFFPLQMNCVFDDVSAICRTKDMMKNQERVTIARYPSDARLVLALFGRMNIFLGMRLHSIIFASKMGIPTVAISYSPKVSDFMKMVSQEKLCIPVMRLDSSIATEKMMNVWDDRTNIIETVHKEVHNLTRRTELNLISARKLLEE